MVRNFFIYLPQDRRIKWNTIQFYLKYFNFRNIITGFKVIVVGAILFRQCTTLICSTKIRRSAGVIFIFS